MTLRECYAIMGGDYDDAIGRLRSERLLSKFVLKFLDDGSYSLLLDAMENGRHEEAFRASHTIKGMCQNLSFTALGQSASELTEALRGDIKPEAGELLARVKEDYRRTADAIEAFRASV